MLERICSPCGPKSSKGFFLSNECTRNADIVCIGVSFYHNSYCFGVCVLFSTVKGFILILSEGYACHKKCQTQPHKCIMEFLPKHYYSFTYILILQHYKEQMVSTIFHSTLPCFLVFPWSLFLTSPSCKLDRPT